MTASVSPGGCLDPVNVVISIGMLQVRNNIIMSCLYNMWLDLYLFLTHWIRHVVARINTPTMVNRDRLAI